MMPNQTLAEVMTPHIDSAIAAKVLQSLHRAERLLRNLQPQPRSVHKMLWPLLKQLLLLALLLQTLLLCSQMRLLLQSMAQQHRHSLMPQMRRPHAPLKSSLLLPTMQTIVKRVMLAF
jgi:hypothetical protein